MKHSHTVSYRKITSKRTEMSRQVNTH